MGWLLRLRSCWGLLRWRWLRCGRWLLLVLRQRRVVLQLWRRQLLVLLRLRSGVAILLLRRRRVVMLSRGQLLVLLWLRSCCCELQLRQQLSV